MINNEKYLHMCMFIVWNVIGWYDLSWWEIFQRQTILWPKNYGCGEMGSCSERECNSNDVLVVK